MRTIPPKLKNELAMDPYYKTCARLGPDCDGRITWEHVFIYSGQQINEKWSIIPLCTYHHAVDEHQDAGALNKELNQFIALGRATIADLRKFPRRDWYQLFNYLASKFAPSSHVEGLHGPFGDCCEDNCVFCTILDEVV